MERHKKELRVGLRQTGRMLKLHRETLRKLTHAELNQVKGGLVAACACTLPNCSGVCPGAVEAA